MARRPIGTISRRAVCQVLLLGDGSRMYAIHPRAVVSGSTGTRHHLWDHQEPAL